MSTMPKTHRFLAAFQDPAVDDALAEASRQLDGPYLRFAVDTLLQRAQQAGLAAVIDCFHRLPADLQSRVPALCALITPVLRVGIRSDQIQTRLNCLEIAGRIGDESLAYLFDMGLVDSQPEVRGQAAVLLGEMAGRLLAEHPLLQVGEVEPWEADRGGNPRWRRGLQRPVEGRTSDPRFATDQSALRSQRSALTAQDTTRAARQSPPGSSRSGSDVIDRLTLRRQNLLQAILSGASRYDIHQRSEPVEACMWFEPYLGSRFWALLEQPRSRLPRLLADMLVTSDQPQAACFLMQALSVPQTRPQAVKALAERREDAWFRAVLRGVQIWHPWPRVRRGCHHIRRIEYLHTLDNSALRRLTGGAALPLLVGAAHLDIEAKGRLMEQILSVAVDPACRRQALLEAGRAREWGPPLLQSALCRSGDPAEVRMAAYGLLQVRHEGLAGDLVKRLSTPGDAAAAGLAGMAADLIFQQLWTQFDVMQEKRRVAASFGFRRLAGCLKVRLRVNLASTSTSDRIRATRIVGLLGMVDVLWRDMLLAGQDRNPRVRAAAVRFLGGSGRPECRQLLLAALEDPDGLVQANAVEAIDESDWPDRLALIVPKLQSDSRRVRANAARALIRRGDAEAGRVLTEMLEDRRPESRLTAIWALHQVGAPAWRDRLAALAETDPSPAVRRYAQAVCERSQPRPAGTAVKELP